MANKKITELTEETSPVGADLLPLVDDVSGTPTTKKVTVTNLMTQAPVQAADISGLATQVSLGNHEALTSSVHGISAFGATLVDDADASAARTTLGLGTAATSASTDFSPAFFSTVSETTTARTLSDSDNGKIIVCSNSSPTIVTVPNGLTTGFSCTVVQSNTATVSVVGSGGASVVGYDGNTATAGQYAALNVIPTAVNSYVIEGDSGSPPFVNNYSLGLDGVDDYATLGSTFSSITGSKSITGWFRFDNTSQNAVTTTTANQYGWLFWASNTMYFRTGAGTQTFTIPAVSTGTWYHFALTGDGTTLKLYIDGVQQGGDKTDGSWQIKEFFRGSTSFYFDGDVDEIGLWTGTELSASDVLAIANTGAGSGSKAVDLDAYTGLTHWWRFGDGDTGSTVTDNKGSNNLTLVNSPTFITQVP
jgi:hypothetical protein